MIHTPAAMFEGLVSAALDRMTLMANHLLSGELQAMERLRPHAGSVVDASGLLPALVPAFLPALSQGASIQREWCCRITPAGLLERVPNHPSHAALTFTSQSLTHILTALRDQDTTIVQVTADKPGLESDLRWVVDNLRWDYAADIERVLPARVGPLVARTAQQLSEGLAQGLKAAEGWLTREPR